MRIQYALLLLFKCYTKYIANVLTVYVERYFVQQLSRSLCYIILILFTLHHVREEFNSRIATSECYLKFNTLYLCAKSVHTFRTIYSYA